MSENFEGMGKLEAEIRKNGLSNKRRCDKCKKIKVLSAFRYVEGESYNLCIACDYGKRRKRAPERYYHHPIHWSFFVGPGVFMGPRPKCLIRDYYDEIGGAPEKKCITCKKEMALYDFAFEEGATASIPLDPLDIEYMYELIDNALSGTNRAILKKQEELKKHNQCPPICQQRGEEHIAHVKRIHVIAEKIKRTLQKYPMTKNHYTDILFDSSELDWLNKYSSYCWSTKEIDVGSKKIKDDLSSYWQFGLDIYHTIQQQTRYIRKPKCRYCIDNEEGGIAKHLAEEREMLLCNLERSKQRKVDKQRDTIKMELLNSDSSTSIEKGTCPVKKVQVIILGHEPISVIQKFLDKFFPKRRTSSKRYRAGARYMHSHFIGYSSPYLLDIGNRIGCSTYESEAKPILEVVGFEDDIPLDCYAIVRRTTEYEILNENYLMEELNAKAPRDIRGL